MEPNLKYLSRFKSLKYWGAKKPTPHSLRIASCYMSHRGFLLRLMNFITLQKKNDLDCKHRAVKAGPPLLARPLLSSMLFIDFQHSARFFSPCSFIPSLLDYSIPLATSILFDYFFFIKENVYTMDVWVHASLIKIWIPMLISTQGMC